MTAQENKNDNSIAHGHSDFSIDHILNRAGSSASCSNVNFQTSSDNTTSANLTVALDPYSWLQCTRYCPPKVARTQRRDGPQKRQLGRHPRIPFSSHQLSVLEEKFQKSAYLSSEEVTTLSRQLHLVDVRVKIWFQNRRARDRREKLQNSHKIPENRKETNSACGVSVFSVKSSPESVYNYSPDQSLLQTHLSNYFLPVSNQDHFTSKETR